MRTISRILVSHNGGWRGAGVVPRKTSQYRAFVRIGGIKNDANATCFVEFDETLDGGGGIWDKWGAKVGGNHLKKWSDCNKTAYVDVSKNVGFLKVVLCGGSYFEEWDFFQTNLFVLQWRENYGYFGSAEVGPLGEWGDSLESFLVLKCTGGIFI